MEPLLATKIAIPSTHATLIQRPHLFAALDKPLKVWVVSALAGAGKTMLLAKWLRARGHRSAWFSLDHGDNDPHRFAHYLNAAMASASTTVKPADQPLYIVLDSYENIEGQAIHELLAEIIRTSAPNEHFIILSRLNVPSHLVENSKSYGYLGGLNCTQDEVAQIVNSAFAELLPEGILNSISTQLHQQTEGWITGVKLAVDGLQRCTEDELGVYLTDPLALVARHIEEYLIQETLFIQPRKLQRFMLYTSVLSDFNADLCRVVTEQEDSAALLDDARRANLLIATEAANGQRYFHYPHLLSSALQARLKRQEPEIIAVLQQQVAAWYQAQGAITEAIDHWLLVPAHTRAVALLEQHFPELLDQHQYPALRRWLTLLPAPLVAERPLLVLIQAALQALEGDMRQATAIQSALDLVRQQTPDTELQTTLYLLASQLSHAHAWMEQAAMDELAVNQAYGLWLEGDLLGAEALLADQVTTWRAQSSPQLSIALVVLGRVQIARNKLRLAEITLLEAARFATDVTPAIRALSYLSLADIYLEWNRLDEASTYLQQCFAVRDLPPELRVSSWLLYSTLSDAMLAPQRSAIALRLIRHLLPSVSPALYTQVVGRQLGLDITSGDLTSAWRWLYRCGLGVHDQVTYNQWTDYRLLAWVSLHLHKPEDAAVMTESLVKVSRASAWDYRVVQALILQAVAHEMSGHVNAALAIMAQAVTLAESGELVRSFIDGFKVTDHPVLRLLKMLKSQRARQGDQRGTYSDAYLQRLIAAGEPSAPRAVTPSNSVMIEPLSTREQEIMRLLAQGYSNQKIAARMLIAESTVKRHINNIYGKLQVNSRTQALRKAEELGLI